MSRVETYSKLVRDRIPDIIEQDGGRPIIKELTAEELRKALFAKVVEEAGELAAAMEENDIYKELVDLEEVMAALSDASSAAHSSEAFTWSG